MPEAQARGAAAQQTDDWHDRLAEAERGQFISAEAIEEWAASWLATGELPPPDPDVFITRLG